MLFRAAKRTYQGTKHVQTYKKNRCMHVCLRCNGYTLHEKAEFQPPPSPRGTAHDRNAWVGREIGQFMHESVTIRCVGRR